MPTPPGPPGRVTRRGRAYTGRVVGSTEASEFKRDLNLVEVYIGYLRRKIDVGGRPIIQTLRGGGYVMRPALAPPVRFTIRGVRKVV